MTALGVLCCFALCCLFDFVSFFLLISHLKHVHVTEITETSVYPFPGKYCECWMSGSMASWTTTCVQPVCMVCTSAQCGGICQNHKDVHSRYACEYVYAECTDTYVAISCTLGSQCILGIYIPRALSATTQGISCYTQLPRI